MSELERLRAELDEARLAAESYRQLLDAATDAIFVHDAETGRILDVNATVLSLYRMTREEALAAEPQQLSLGEPPYSADEAVEWIRKAVTEGPQVFEWVARRRDGELFPVEVALSYAVLGGARRVLAVVRDVSRRQQAEQALAYRTRLEALISEIATRFVSVGADDVDAQIEVALGELARFAEVNAGYLMQFADDGRTFGMTHLWNDGVLSTRKEEVRGLRAAVMPWWMDRLARNEVVAVPSVSQLPPEASVEQGIIAAQGVKAVIDVPLLVHGRVAGFLGFNSATDHRPWSEAEAALLRFVGQVFMSALERARAERALRASEEQLLQAQKMEAIGRLAGGIAHDFNNLLTVVSGYAELLLVKLRPEDPIRVEVAEIRRAGQRAEVLTRQLLAFSRKQVGDPRVTSLDDVVERSQRLLERVIGEDVTLGFERGPAAPRVRVDPAHVDQILVNLATNARDAMPDGGVLRLQTARTHCSEAFCQRHGGLRAGDYAVLTVSDSGEGIPEELVPRVFEPFFSTKEPGKGTGLGLSTVYGLMRQYDGFVTVESPPGAGATFRLYFPRCDASVRDPDRALAEPPVTGRARILLVEDEELVRSLAAQLLRHQGFGVVVASGPLEACELVEGTGERFDLLLTDVVMPVMKGPELYERLRRTQPGLPCLYMSGYAEDVVVHHGATAASQRLLRKPFTLASLTRSVDAALAD